jgi:hypothetical protein
MSLPEEPAGPLWDDKGMRYEKGRDGEWRDPDGYARPWAILLQQCGTLDDEPPLRQAWEQSKPGAYYWVEGYDSSIPCRAAGIGVTTPYLMLTVPPVVGTGLCLLSPDDEDDELTELTPILAVPADALTNLVNARRPEAVRGYQNEIIDWLGTHKQAHWEDN